MEEVLSLLYCPPTAAGHVALDPLPEVLGSGLLGLVTLDKGRFAGSFAGMGTRGFFGAPRMASKPSRNTMWSSARCTRTAAGFQEPLPPERRSEPEEAHGDRSRIDRAVAPSLNHTRDLFVASGTKGGVAAARKA